MELPNHNKSMFKHSITHKPVRVCPSKLIEQEALPVPASTIRASDVSWLSSRRLSRTTRALNNQRGQRQDGLQEISVFKHTDQRSAPEAAESSMTEPLRNVLELQGGRRLQK